MREIGVISPGTTRGGCLPGRGRETWVFQGETTRTGRRAEKRPLQRAISRLYRDYLAAGRTPAQALRLVQKRLGGR
jgi:hypothetical protein